MVELIRPNWPAPSNVHAFISTRIDGVSAGNYTSLNLGDHVGDAPSAVTNNRSRFARACDIDAERIAWLKQVHGSSVVNLDRVVAPTYEADASMTQCRDLACAVMTADCLPILFCDRSGQRVAAVHAGWRGLAGGVIESALDGFEQTTEVMAYLGPAISQKHFEVGAEVYSAFVALDDSNAEAFIASSRSTKDDPRYMADIYHLAKNALAKRGVRAVFGGEYCTYADERRFYSYRRDGAVSGRLASLIYLR